MSAFPSLFEDSDLSGLPTSDPGDNKPWKYAGATGFQLVIGAFTPSGGVTNPLELGEDGDPGVLSLWDGGDGDYADITSNGGELLYNGSSVAMSSAIVTDHGALTGLGDDDHTQYLLVNGSRALTGNIVTKQIVIDAKNGVDLKLGATGGGIFGFGIGNYLDTFLAFYVGNDGFSYSAAGANMPIGKGYNFINSGSSIDAVNTSIRLASSGCLEINNGTNGQSRDLKLRDLYLTQYVRTESGLLVVKNDLSAYTPVFCSNATLTGMLFIGSYTVATLPSASANTGAEAQVTDSSVTTYRTTVSGGGSNRVKVFSNGTNWLVN